MIGPIYFNVRTVREYLVTNGHVYTLRKPRGVGITDAVTGSYFKHKTFAKVEVKLVITDVLMSTQLDPYFGESGLFSSSYKWLELAQIMSGGKLNLYKVTIVERL
jgi:hypothetical protein